jgi:hypothetical protein
VGWLVSSPSSENGRSAQLGRAPTRRGKPETARMTPDSACGQRLRPGVTCTAPRQSSRRVGDQMMMRFRVRRRAYHPRSPFCPALASGSCLPRPKLTGRGARLSREGQVVSGRGGGAGDHTTRPLGACPFRAFERGRVSTRVLRLGGFGNAFDVRIGLACHMAIQVGCSDMAWCGLSA